MACGVEFLLNPNFYFSKIIGNWVKCLQLFGRAETIIKNKAFILVIELKYR